MIPPEQTVALLLCAGLSRRFGPGNKLLARVDGKPLAGHAAVLCSLLPFKARLAVVPPGEERLREILRASGFALVENPAPEAGQESSLRLGFAKALELGGRAMLVLLADMPHVSADHLRALCAAGSDERGAISRAGETRSPPALFPVAKALAALARPDLPPRFVLKGAAEVAAASASLADYDRREQFDEPSATE